MPRTAKLVFGIVACLFGWGWLSMIVVLSRKALGWPVEPGIETLKAMLYGSPGLALFCFGVVQILRAIRNR